MRQILIFLCLLLVLFSQSNAQASSYIQSFPQPIPVAQGGTGTTTSTGTGSVVLAGSPTFSGNVTANTINNVSLVGPSVGTMILNASSTGGNTYILPSIGGTLTALGNTATGTGSVALATSPTLTTPTLSGATLTGTTTAGAISASSLTLTSVLAVAYGGTGLGTSPLNGQLLIGNGTGYTLNTLSSSNSTISVANGIGSISLTVNPTLSLTSLSLTTPLSAANGGTGTTTLTGTGSVVLSASPTFTGNVTVNTINNTTLNGAAGVLSIVASAGGASISMPSGSSFTLSNPYAVSIGTTGATNITLPTSGTLIAEVGTATTNRLAYWTGGATLADTAGLNWDNTNGFLGIGAAPSSYLYINPVPTTARAHIVSNLPYYNGTYSTTTSDAYFSQPTVNIVGTITNLIGVHLGNPQKTAGAVINSYALYIDTQNYAGASNYAIYSEAGNKSVHNGSITIGAATDPTAYLTLGAGTAAANTAPIKLMAGTNTTTPAAGQIEYDGVSIYTTPTALIRHTLDGSIFTSTTDVTVANTVTETSVVGTGVGTIALPANFFTIGKVIRFHVEGYFSTTGTPTLDFKVKLGSIIILDTTANTLSPASITGREFFIDGFILCRTTGITGTVTGGGGVFYATSHIANVLYDDFGPITTPITIDTTATQTLDITATWGTAAVGNTLTSIAVTAAVQR